MARGERILVVGPAWVGDMVMAQSLLRLLRERDAGALIDVIGPPWSVPLTARMPEVRRGIALDVRHGEPALLRRWRLGRSLRGAYDRAIVLPRSFKAALPPWIARVPLRTGFAAEGRRWLLSDPRPLDRSVLDQTVKRFLALGLPAGAALPESPPQPVLRVDPANRDALLGRFGLGRAPAVALMPGAAYGPAKQWPIEYYAELAASIVADGEEVWVLGSAGERPLGERICAVAGPGASNLCGQTRLEDSVDLLSAARAAVSNDSGLMHVAAAAGTRVIALYGSSSPRFTPPLTARAVIHYLDLDCSPCFQRECPLGHLHCLRGITVAAVKSSLG